MLLQVRRLSLLFARRASWHVNCQKTRSMHVYVYRGMQYIYFLLSCSPGAAAWVDMPHTPLSFPLPQCPPHEVFPELELQLSCQRSSLSLPAVAYFNPPRWWRAYIIHNYRFHFCLPVIIVAFLDVFCL